MVEKKPETSSGAARLRSKRCTSSKPPACVVAFRGPSLFDGTPVRVVVYTLQGTKNQKLGPMVQVLISPDGIPPHVAVRDGRDRAVCGDCVHRPVNGGTCYVVLPRYFPQVWKQTSRLTDDLAVACGEIRKSGLPLRVGAWGDPAAVPFEVIESLVHSAPKSTAYTSAWRTCDRRLARIAMASVISVEEREEAKNLGFRTFRIRTASMPVMAGEMICPATPEGGKRKTCSECVACRGTDARHKMDVVIVGHGSANKVKRLSTLLENSGASAAVACEPRRPGSDRVSTPVQLLLGEDRTRSDGDAPGGRRP